MTVRWGILGPGHIANAFATGLAAIESGRLVAVGSRDAARSRAFGARHGADEVHCHGSYAALVADPEVDAIYVASPHPWHLEHALLAFAAGKHVLCEKPAGMRALEVGTMIAAARTLDRFFMEGFMYRCHPWIGYLGGLLSSDVVGAALHVDATFGFDVPRDPSSRLFDHALGGGGILDVGCYPMSVARLVAGLASGSDVEEPDTIIGHGLIGPTQVDEVAHASLRFPSGMTANLGCAVTRALGSRVAVRGESGTIEISHDCWLPGARGGEVDVRIAVVPDEGERYTIDVPADRPLYAYEADVASRAITRGLREAPSPAPTFADSLGNARALDAWRAAVGYVAVGDVVQPESRGRGATASASPTSL